MCTENSGSYVLCPVRYVSGICFFLSICTGGIFQAMVQVKGILLFRKFLHPIYCSQLDISTLTTFIEESFLHRKCLLSVYGGATLL